MLLVLNNMLDRQVVVVALLLISAIAHMDHTHFSIPNVTKVNVEE